VNFARDAAMPVHHGAKNIERQDLNAVRRKRRGVHAAILSRCGAGAVAHTADKLGDSAYLQPE
jgi:hypothetical protein